MVEVAERFIRYAKVDTRSDEKSDKCPSSDMEWDLARILEKELISMGLTEVILDDNCYLTATLESNSDRKLPVLGLIAHLDTSPDMSGTGVNPLIWKEYDGSDIILNKRDSIILSPTEFPELLRYRGDDIITTDGTTLLGADDKAGIAEIMTAIEYFIANPSFKHGRIRICFTPDEEIGRGADRFDTDRFGADFAFTVDGGELGELEFENFNAALATITIQGRNVHPGTAKNQMINSINIANEFINLLPAEQRPEHTEGYEGFFHVVDLSGTVEQSTVRFIIRDHNMDNFITKKRMIDSVTGFLNNKYGGERVKSEIKDQYFNMREKIEPHIHIINLAADSMREAGIEPLIKPIRGGTDGARLSFMGLPCPNIFTGGHNFHGKYEFIPINSMTLAVKTIINIISNIPKRY